MRLRTRWFLGLGWLAGLLLLALAAHLKDPHLLPWRALATPLMLGLCLLGLWVWLGAGRRWTHWLGSLPLWLALLLTLAGEYRFHAERAWVLDTPAPQARLLGAHFIVGFRDPETILPLIHQGLVSGVFIAKRNVVGRSHEELQRLIGQFQAARRAAGLPPLIIAADQEGGIVSRLSPPLPQHPPLSSLLRGHPSTEQLAAAARRYGETQGREMAALGVHLNFSPVVDLLPTQRATFDFHSAIAQRAIAADPAIVSTVALAYVQGLEHSGVQATLKHFPGLGRVPEDTHHFSARLDTPIALLEGSDWRPFREVSARTNALLMLGHVQLTALDAQTPASFSAAVVQGLIRQRWQHEGVLITDDLTMAAAYSHGLCKATVKALAAGVDLLLISYDDDKIYPALACARRALDEGRLMPQHLAQSAQRLARTFPRTRPVSDAPALSP